MKKDIFKLSIIVFVVVVFMGCSIVSGIDTNPVVTTNTLNRHTSKQQDPIYFTEDSSIAVSDFLNRSLGVRKIVIQKGDYYIDFSKNPYGSIEFRMAPDESDFEQTDIGPIYGISIAIRIAKRKSRHYTCSCCSGIGFKCGFASVTTRYKSLTEFEKYNIDQRAKYATVSYNRSLQTIQLDFLQPVNWDEMEK